MAGTPITLNGNSLQTDNILTSLIDHESSPTLGSLILPIAHSNKSVVPYQSYPQKPVSLSGKLVFDSIIELDTFLDIFRSWFIGKDLPLDIGYGGSTRRYIVTPLSQVNIVRIGGLTHADYSITMVATSPFGRNVLPTTLVNETGRTAATYSDAVVLAGSAPWQQPILTITYSSITDGTGKTVIFGNNATGQQLEIVGDFTTGDVLSVNVVEKTVKLNGQSIDFSGAFPEFSPGGQSVFYSDDFSARTMDYNLIYYPQWL